MAAIVQNSLEVSPPHADEPLLATIYEIGPTPLIQNFWQQAHHLGQMSFDSWTATYKQAQREIDDRISDISIDGLCLVLDIWKHFDRTVIAKIVPF